MLAALTLSLAQLGDLRIRRVLGKSLLSTVALLATLGVVLWFATRGLALWLGASNGVSGLTGIVGVLAAIALGWLLFRAVAIAVLGVFADEVVEAVEARHYPDALAAAQPLPFTHALTMGLRSAGRAIAVNLLASPVYLLLIATGIGTAVGFFVVNAVLLGRDLFDMVAVRHLSPATLPAVRLSARRQRWTLGGIGTAMLLVPGFNLIAPVVGAAMATHLFHRSILR